VEQRTIPRTRGSARRRTSGASLLPENASSASPAPGADPEEYRGVDWAFIGDNGLRAGWSVLIFVPIYFIALFTLGTAASLIVGNIVHNRLGSGTALSAGIGELVPFFAMLIAAASSALSSTAAFWTSISKVRAACSTSSRDSRPDLPHSLCWWARSPPAAGCTLAPSR